jgi:quercetin dioxygenase-like cupin family protein
MTEDFSIVQPSTVPIERTSSSETPYRELTPLLGCSEIRINQIVLEPGDRMTRHYHKGQEEVYIAQTDGQLFLSDEVHDVTEGSIVRVSPDTVRYLRNDTDDATHRWLAIGAPQVGSRDDFGAAVGVE